MLAHLVSYMNNVKIFGSNFWLDVYRLFPKKLSRIAPNFKNLVNVTQIFRKQTRITQKSDLKTLTVKFLFVLTQLEACCMYM